jgi:hypothetical protein
MEKLTRGQYRERAAAKVAVAQEVLAAEVSLAGSQEGPTFASAGQ